MYKYFSFRTIRTFLITVYDSLGKNLCPNSCSEAKPRKDTNCFVIIDLHGHTYNETQPFSCLGFMPHKLHVHWSIFPAVKRVSCRQLDPSAISFTDVITSGFNVHGYFISFLNFPRLLIHTGVDCLKACGVPRIDASCSESFPEHSIPTCSYLLF